MKMLEGKTVIVTGTAQGMGRKMVEVFAKNGANLFAHARTQTPEHTAFCRETAEREAVRVMPLYFDLRDTEAMKEAVKAIRAQKRL